MRRSAPNIVKISPKFIDSSIPDVSIHGDRLVTVRVPEDDVGDPEFANLIKIVRRAFPINLSNHMYTSSSDKILRASSVFRLL